MESRDERPGGEDKRQRQALAAFGAAPTDSVPKPLVVRGDVIETSAGFKIPNGGSALVTAIRPRGAREKYHRHAQHGELVIVVEGRGDLRIRSSERGEPVQLELHAGDLAGVPVGALHMFRWQSNHGLAYIVHLPHTADNNPSASVAANGHSADLRRDRTNWPPLCVFRGDAA
jgi:mannose-6-phosphate isomerase-like protein (cupin superfamily)